MQQDGGVLSLLSLAGLIAVTLASSNYGNFEQLQVSEMCALLPADTSFLRPNTCNNWVRCPANASNLEEGACASGLYYNKEVGRCTLAEQVTCPYTDVDPSPCASEQDGTFVAEPGSCNGYILCKDHKEIHANCPSEMVFNPIKRACVYTNHYDCVETGSKTVTPVCRALPNNTRLADQLHCQKYYVCINNVLHERECGSQTAYDVARGRCVSVKEVQCYATAAMPAPENTFCLDKNSGQPRQGYFADDLSCNHYYICKSPVNGKHDTAPQYLACALGQYFDYEKLSCRDRMNVKCLLDRCIGSSQTYVNVAGDCQLYARCFNGTTVSRGRCPSNYYFDEPTQGCTPNNYNYIACSA